MRMFMMLLLLTAMCLAETEAAEPGEECGRQSPQLAFPTAGGYGRFARGGRGGRVIPVTNLLDYARGERPIPGSLRAALEAKGPRTVVFRVGGTIRLKRALGIRNPYVTIAGQTAPGQGICLTHHGLFVTSTHDVILRYLRCRPGDAAGRAALEAGQNGWSTDSISVRSSQDIILDHCSASWGTDETLSVSHTPTDRVTVQWCFISEGLADSTHDKGPHSMGGTDSRLANGRISRHHNLYAHNNTRNPRPGSVHDEDVARFEAQFNIVDSGMTYDFRNNVIYNWGGSRAGYTTRDSDRITMNYVANYLKPGPDSTGETAFNAAPRVRIYQRETLVNGRDVGWEGISKKYIRLDKPVMVAPVLTEPARVAFERVLTEGGASRPIRDGVDERIVTEVRQGAGRIINSQDEVGGYPELPEIAWPEEYDTDNDGMADAWELRHGLSPKVDDHLLDADGDGYTALEEFLNQTDPNAYDGAIETMQQQDHERKMDVPSLSANETPTDVAKGELLYRCAFDTPQSVADWTMEGVGELAFSDDGWMTMWSPDEEYHHVFWTPVTLPDRFVAEWEYQNLKPEAGLCIVFFAATGKDGQDIFSPDLAKRNATFPQYTNGDLRCYHISYMANNPGNADRDTSNLRKNPGKHLVATGPIAVRASDTDVHRLQLVKDGRHIRMSIDGRPVIDWADDGRFGSALTSGRLGLRQMKWTRARYRNLRVWELAGGGRP